ncbi:MAG TPA: hypothetical protein VKT77_07450, partial [Chthonomonadaceae bacterium]|nr:hypothetical protein [Chthonomonadaceae bacterium]
GALGRYGVTNEQLDTVSNAYRYARGRGELWTHRPAVAYAHVKDGVVIGFEVADAGAGYSSVPGIAVPGVPGAKARAELSFSRRLDTNGSISAIRLLAGK